VFPLSVFISLVPFLSTFFGWKGLLLLARAPSSAYFFLTPPAASGEGIEALVLNLFSPASFRSAAQVFSPWVRVTSEGPGLRVSPPHFSTVFSLFLRVPLFFCDFHARRPSVLRQVMSRF